MHSHKAKQGCLNLTHLQTVLLHAEDLLTDPRPHLHPVEVEIAGALCLVVLGV